MRSDRRKLLEIGVGGSAAIGAAGLLSGASFAAAKSDFDVVVIGAGFSGLAAARTLTQSGVTRIAVLEARDRVGGRVVNQRVAAGFPVPAGAAWVGPGQWAVIDLAQELGVALTPQFNAGEDFIVAGGAIQKVPAAASPIANEAFVRNIDALARTVPTDAPWTAANAAQWDGMSYADYLATAGLSQDDLATLSLTTTLSFGAPPAELSFLYVLFDIYAAGGVRRMESTQGGAQESWIVGGSQVLALKMAEDLGDVVRLSSPVTLVRGWNGPGPVEIVTAKGVVRARQVIMALSPSQAAAITFSPTLPEAKAALIAAWPTAGSGVKIHASYPRPFWRDLGLSGNIYDLDGPFAWATDASPPDASVGVLTALGRSGDAMTTAARRAATLAVFAKCFGPQALNPTAYVEMDWSKEKYTRGCVSPLGKGVLSRHGAAIRQSTGRLTWAGTETSTVWMGYMDGAVRSGRRAAGQALAALVKSGG